MTLSFESRRAQVQWGDPLRAMNGYLVCKITGYFDERVRRREVLSLSARKFDVLLSTGSAFGIAA